MDRSIAGVRGAEPAESSGGEEEQVRPRRDDELGGESACYAHLVCPGCGSLLDGAGHAPGCHGSA